METQFSLYRDIVPVSYRNLNNNQRTLLTEQFKAMAAHNGVDLEAYTDAPTPNRSDTGIITFAFKNGVLPDMELSSISQSLQRALEMAVKNILPSHQVDLDRYGNIEVNNNQHNVMT